MHLTPMPHAPPLSAQAGGLYPVTVSAFSSPPSCPGRSFCRACHPRTPFAPCPSSPSVATSELLLRSFLAVFWRLPSWTEEARPFATSPFLPTLDFDFF